MFTVKINTWNSSFNDTYDFEYSGIEHTTREEAEKELAEAEKKLKMISILGQFILRRQTNDNRRD